MNVSKLKRLILSLCATTLAAATCSGNLPPVGPVTISPVVCDECDCTVGDVVDDLLDD